MQTVTANTQQPQSAETKPATAEPNPYLQGNFGPVPREETFTELSVTGELPRDLRGILLRNGPNPVGAVDDKHHWFVGDAMLHAVAIEDGRARSYRNRFVRTPHVEAVLGLPAAPRSKTPYPIQGSGNVNVIEHGGRILALPEVGLPYELTRTLETRGEHDFAGKLVTSMTAHPKIDPLSGELLFFGYDFGPTHLRYHVAAPDGTLTRTLEIATPRSTMIHDFGVTQTRVVFMDMPVVFDLELVAQGYRMPFRWDASHQARIGILPRNATSDVTKWIEIPSCYVFHVLNTYDDGARIVMDVVRYEHTFVRDRRGPIEDSLGKLVRWTIDPERGRVDEALFDATPQEFPRVSPLAETQRHRYGYALEVGADPKDFAFHGLLKHDYDKRSTLKHDVGRGRSAGEGVFVPRVGTGLSEDAGYVLAPVYDATTNKSDIVVIDAERFDAKPLATIHLPVRIPFGFHGNFVTLD